MLQKAPGYNTRSWAPAAIKRYKALIGDGLRSREDGRRTIKVGVAPTLPSTPATTRLRIVTVAGDASMLQAACTRTRHLPPP
jgi:hypothetical protein